MSANGITAVGPLRAVARRASPGHRVEQSGVALAVVIWFVAAMSILVAGIVYQARMDTRLTRLQLSQARAMALADGAIQLALADMMRLQREGENLSRGIRSGTYELDETRVVVGFTPVTGLVDLNMGAEELLVALFAHGAGVGENYAEELASNMVEWRSPGRGSQIAASEAAEMAGARNGRFEAIEDLMLVTGVDRDIFESIRDSVYVAQQGQTGVDWASAPASVLAVLFGGDGDRAREIAEERAGGAEGPGVPPSGLNLSHQQQQASSLYRVDALVQLDGEHLLRRRWVDRQRQGGDGLPWSFFRSEPVRSLSDEQTRKLVALNYADAGN